MLLPVVAFVLLKMVSATAGDEDAPDEREMELYKRLYDFGLGKRDPYTYLSEYKRLPVYNFGLGKRGGERRYAFGLGKRDRYDEEDEAIAEDMEYGKRMRPYGFGLGKRSGAGRQQSKAYNFGLGKRPEGKLYSFGLGKRSYPLYDLLDDLPDDEGGSSEEEKRAAGGVGAGHSRFSFGLGKREAVPVPAEGRLPQQHPTRL